MRMHGIHPVPVRGASPYDLVKPVPATPQGVQTPPLRPLKKIGRAIRFLI